MSDSLLNKEEGQSAPLFPICVLLVDDQQMIGESVRRMLADHADISFHYCQDPSKAIEIAEKVCPTVILQDLVMPEIDGLLLLKYFRANSKTKDVPMIVLSAKEDPLIKANAFALGANDYIVKLPDKIELIARIRYHSAAYIRLLERNQAYQSLAKSQLALQAELNEAAGYVRSILPAPLNDRIQTNWVFEPSMVLGGDAFGYHWLDDDHFAFYLLDVCGHGVGAALLSITVINFLRSNTLQNMNFYEPSSVLVGLNQTFQMENHNNMYFTMWYGVFCPSSREIVFSSGGHPPPILITGPTEALAETKVLKTPGMVVGGMPDLEFVQSKVQVGAYNRLYLFSDGVYEIYKEDGSMVDYEEFQRLIEKLPQDPTGEEDMKRIVAFGKGFTKGKSFADDFSILRIIF